MRFLLLLAILTISSCKNYKPPKVELCGVTQDGDLACNDPRLDNSDYFRIPEVGDLCTNANDYEKMRSYCINLRTKLIKCERGR